MVAAPGDPLGGARPGAHGVGGWSPPRQIEGVEQAGQGRELWLDLPAILCCDGRAGGVPRGGQKVRRRALCRHGLCAWF